MLVIHTSHDCGLSTSLKNVLNAANFGAVMNHSSPVIHIIQITNLSKMKGGKLNDSFDMHLSL